MFDVITESDRPLRERAPGSKAVSVTLHTFVTKRGASEVFAAHVERQTDTVRAQRDVQLQRALNGIDFDEMRHPC